MIASRCGRLGIVFSLCGFSLGCEPPERIDFGTPGVGLVDTRPAVAVRGDQAVVAWHRLGNEVRTSSFFAGGTWTTPAVVGTGVFPEVAVSSSTIVFTVYDEPSVGLRAARRTLAGWGAPETLDAGGSSDYSVAADGAGNAIAVWSRAGIRARRFRPSFGWGAETVLDPVGSGKMTVAMNERGTAVVGSCSGGRLRSVRYVPGTGWTGESLSEPDCCPSGVPLGALGVSAGISEEGDPVVVGSDFWTTRVCAFAGGSWTTLHVPGIDVQNPSLAVNATGSALAAWVTRPAGATINARVYNPGVGWRPLLTLRTPVDSQNVGVGLGSTGNGAIVFAASGNVYHTTYNASAAPRLSAPAVIDSTSPASYYLRTAFDPREPNRGVTAWRHESSAAGAEVWASRLGL